jgi:hypothetical protein
MFPFLSGLSKHNHANILEVSVKKIVAIAVVSAALLFIAGCAKSGNSNPTGNNNNNNSAAGVSADLVGTWNFYFEAFDSVVEDMSLVISSNNIIMDSSSMVPPGGKPIAKNGNLGYVFSSATGYLFDYSLSPDKDSLYLIGETTPTATSVTREAAQNGGAGVWVKQ